MEIVNGVLKKVEDKDIIDGTFVVPDGVTSIGNSVFYKCKFLRSVIIPEGVKSIGVSAFDGCSSLTEISIPESVNIIMDNAFFNCHSLKKITLPENLKKIGGSAFYDCNQIEELNTPWGTYKLDELSKKDISSIYLYLYANSILKEKYSNIRLFLATPPINSIINSPVIDGKNAIQKFKNLFYKMRKSYDINKELFTSMSLETTEKFNFNTWNKIKNLFNWQGSGELSQAFAEMIELFGLFEKDKEKESRVQDFLHFFQEKPYIIFKNKYDDLIWSTLNMSDMYKLINSSFLLKTNNSYQVLNRNTDIPLEFQCYLREELSEKAIKKIKKLTGTYGKQINDFLKEHYRTFYLYEYELKEEFYDNEDIQHLLFHTDLIGHVNYSSLHRMFDGCNKTFNEDFYQFFQDNLEFILHSEKLQSKVKDIQKNFEKMRKHYLYQSGTEEITLKQALDYLDNIPFDYHDGNLEFAQDVKKAGVSSEEAFSYYQKIFEQNDIRKLSSLIKRSNIYEIDGYTIKAELLRKDDSFSMLVGETNYTNCCQVFGGKGHNCMAHAVNSDDGGIFVTKLLKDGEWILLTESWDWQNNNVYCHDNIEATSYLKNDAKLRKAVAKVYRLDGELIIKKSREEVEKYIKTRKKTIEKSSNLKEKEKALEELRELEEREVIRVVTAGEGHDDLGLSNYFKQSIKVNEGQFIGNRKFTLENFQPVHYNSNQPYFNRDKDAYTDSDTTQYIIAGSIEELCFGKLEPLVPIYRDERRVVLEKSEDIRNYTVKKIKDMESIVYPESMMNYQDANQSDFEDSNILLGEDWYIIYEEQDDNSIYISDLAKVKPSLEDEKSIQDQEIMNVIYDLVRKYEKVEADLKEDTSYLLFLMNKKLGYFEQIGEDTSYPFENRNNTKIITEEEQDTLLKNAKIIKQEKNPNHIMHHVTFKQGRLLGKMEEKNVKYY